MTSEELVAAQELYDEMAAQADALIEELLYATKA